MAEELNNNSLRWGVTNNSAEWSLPEETEYTTEVWRNSAGEAILSSTGEEILVRVPV